jgi:hypothetical protein
MESLNIRNGGDGLHDVESCQPERTCHCDKTNRKQDRKVATSKKQAERSD